MRKRLLTVGLMLAVALGVTTAYSPDAGAAGRTVIASRNDNWCC